MTSRNVFKEAKSEMVEGFIESIKRFREKRKMTQLQLSEYVGVSLSTIRRWESGVSMPAMNEVVRLANRLEMSIDELITGIPGESADICRETGLSAESIQRLKEINKNNHMQRIIDHIISAPRYIEDILVLEDVIKLKMKMYSGECSCDGTYGLTKNAIRGAQWELMNAYGELISTYTSNVAKKRLEKEGVECVSEYNMRRYITDEEDGW